VYSPRLTDALINASLTGLVGGCAGAPAASPTDATAAPTAMKPADWPDGDWRTAAKGFVR